MCACLCIRMNLPITPRNNAAAAATFSSVPARDTRLAQTTQAPRSAPATRLPKKTEFKQGHDDPLAGMADGPRHNINQAIAFGNKLARSGLAGVAQIGEGVKLATDIVKGLNGAINGAPKFFSDAGDVLSGRTKTSLRDLAAGTVSGAGKFGYGMGGSLVDSGARIVAPGKGRDTVAEGLGKGQSWFDTVYRNEVKKKVGVNPDSKGYSVGSTTAQIAGEVLTTGRAMNKQAKLNDASIQAVARDAAHPKGGTARSTAGSTALKPASTSDRAHSDVLKTLRNNPDVQKAMDHTLSPAEQAKTNRAVQDMAEKDVFRGAHFEPEAGSKPGARKPTLADKNKAALEPGRWKELGDGYHAVHGTHMAGDVPKQPKVVHLKDGHFETQVARAAPELDAASRGDINAMTTRRTIFLRQGESAFKNSTFLHELGHFHADRAFEKRFDFEYRTPDGRTININEGVTEHLARQVPGHRVNQTAPSYPTAVAFVQALEKAVGRDTLARAYFSGHTPSIDKIIDVPRRKDAAF